eukprot:Protomagalhaensia_wolfi_Nauph_80__1218@NODE_1719_length_1382_cov_31_059568_g1335_i0_p1_GENE_NODE_1719_length_1382_cov_31_059568_g1335_i0NODE_1719_length_1382_cov_31_059568_g1335_i0_p1_ORF_typecomplete_len425_score46_37FAM212/PF15342_6/98FAM212/PF15342_6/1_8FAM212/PF15342_6/1_7e03_NODE_1719_length_1382_cov_31_059568_g1335_i01071279
MTHFTISKNPNSSERSVLSHVPVVLGAALKALLHDDFAITDYVDLPWELRTNAERLHNHQNYAGQMLLELCESTSEFNKALATLCSFWNLEVKTGQDVMTALKATGSTMSRILLRAFNDLILYFYSPEIPFPGSFNIQGPCDMALTDLAINNTESNNNGSSASAILYQWPAAMADFTSRLMGRASNGQVPVPVGVWRDIVKLGETREFERHLESQPVWLDVDLFENWVRQVGPILRESGMAVDLPTGYLVKCFEWTQFILDKKAGTDQYCFSNGDKFVYENRRSESHQEQENAPSTISSIVNKLTSPFHGEQEGTDWSSSIMNHMTSSSNEEQEDDGEWSQTLLLWECLKYCVIVMCLCAVVQGARRVFRKSSPSEETQPLLVNVKERID